jgi:hypothetical protein
MKFTLLLFLPLSMVLAAQSGPAATAKPAGQTPSQKPVTQADNKALQETEELRTLRETFSQVLDAANASWFGRPYQQINSVDISGNIAIVLSGDVIDNKIEQLTQGAVRSAGAKSGQAFGTLQGTYFANGDHIYNVNGDFGVMRFWRTGEKGFWYIRDQNAYTTAIDMASPNAPVSFMGWFASVMSDIKEVYVKGSAFQVSKGKDATVNGKAAHTVIFNAPTAPYDPRKREQAASETFSFWKKGRLEIAYDDSGKQPLRMVYSNEAQGVDATLNFTYNTNGRVRQVTISNRSKQWEGPGFITASYNGEGMISAISGELTGSSHKISFNLGTTWNKDKKVSSIQAVVPPTAAKLGREDMELRLAMMFASNIGDLQRTGFNFMVPKVSPVRSALPAPAPVKQ